MNSPPPSSSPPSSPSPPPSPSTPSTVILPRSPQSSPSETSSGPQQKDEPQDGTATPPAPSKPTKCNVVIIGGKTPGSRYISPSDIESHIATPGLPSAKHDQGIQFGHFFEFFAEHHGKDAADVLHFPRPDAAESWDEMQTSM